MPSIERSRGKRAGVGASAAIGLRSREGGRLVDYTPPQVLGAIAEAGARDRQARGYLQHSKFPIQIFRVQQFLDRVPASAKARPALDLGCGPGPYTLSLLEKGYRVVAVDFSRESLRVNLGACGLHVHSVAHVVADLTRVQFAPDSTDLLLMCDFLQHLGGREARADFLRKSFSWLAPGGHFYLSCFNLNLVNRMKGDRRGAFAAGAIPYERIVLSELLAALPEGILVDSIVPMNVFHGVRADRIAAYLPFARHLARMHAVSGRKRGR